MREGRVVRVAGPVVVAEGLDTTRLYNVVRVGRRRLIGEVIRLSGTEAVIQVYEDTGGLQVGSSIEDTETPFDVELGPGLMGGIFDGVQRALPALARVDDRAFARPFLRRGVEVPALDRDRAYGVTLTVAVGDEVAEGDIVATLAETKAIEHRVMVPPGRSGTITAVHSGPSTVEDPIAEIDGLPLTMLSPLASPPTKAISNPARCHGTPGDRTADRGHAVPDCEGR